MKRFFVSLIIGLTVGTIAGIGFVFIVPKLSSIFAHMFFYPTSSVVSVVREKINKPAEFKPAEGQYILDRLDKDIPKEGKVAYADLEQMNIRLFENGEEIGRYDIKSIGREGTAWQTPLGIFDMSYKVENHFSSIGSVWMPYSMHFFGNYFIHGWPYYSNGTPVAEGYSGGCIRLETSDAEQIFKFVDRDTKLIVAHAQHVAEPQRDFIYTVLEKAPELLSSYLVVDITNGEVVASSNSKEKTPIGSITKLMTALISLETLNQYLYVVYDQNIVAIGDLIYPLILEDDSLAGTILSQHKNTRQYTLDMNTRAQSLGMFDTIYVDPNGTNAETISTLDDTARLLSYLYEYKPFLFHLLSKRTYETDQIEVNSIAPESSSYTGSFINIENTSLIHIFEYPVSYTDVESINTFAIIVHESVNAKEDSDQLYTWVMQSLELRK